ncbi:hypothetical protein EON65_32280 [archaeon]|nr:MAG: hypothetical protein EON65_32280 [archaeon]
MHLKNAMVEEMVFAPRLIPFTMSSPLSKVNCGKNFVMAITRDGRLFSWGAGDCGQLGTGRCTLKEVPSEVNFGSNNVCVTEVACGDAHVIAVLEDGSGYAWGLNQRGQCGTGNQKVKEHVPAKLQLGEGNVLFKSVIAEGLSSAAIDTNGALYTWGSTAHNRLLHVFANYSADKKDPSLVSVQVPTLVVSEVLEGMEVEKFLFTKTSAAVLVKATLTKAWPLRGPKRSFNQLMLYGFGLWNSSQILVKFVSKVYSLYNPPRSAIGKLTPDGCIVCKPPKFAETGGYTVSLSMDGGKEFFSQTFDIYIYKEPTILRQSPTVIDFRLHQIPAITLVSLFENWIVSMHVKGG